LPNPLKNIIRLRLTSYEIPNTEYTFTNKKANCSFIIIDVYGEHLIQIDPGNYAINELILAIQLKLSELEGTYSINYINNKIHIEAFINFTLNFKIDSLLRRLADWGLGYNLGFRRRVNEGSDHYIADAFPKIEGEKYYFLEIQDANNMNSRGIDDSNLQAFTKILIDKPRGETIINTISLTFRQEFIYQQPTNIVKLSIRLLDAYGEVVDLNGMDMSLTFELSEITDFKEYRHFLSKGGGQTDFWGSAIQARF
jgi:hypothetical protein